MKSAASSSSAMTADQSAKRLTLKYRSETRNIALGILYVFCGLMIAFGGLAMGSGCFIFVPLGLGFLVWGLRTLFMRPCMFCFDRGTGQLTVLRRTLVSRKSECFALSDISAVQLLESTYDDSRGYCVSLALQGPPGDVDQQRKDLRLTPAGTDRDERLVKAEVVASFLGLPLEVDVPASFIF